jgi:hypothetical protein
VLEHGGCIQSELWSRGKFPMERRHCKPNPLAIRLQLATQFAITRLRDYAITRLRDYANSQLFSHPRIHSRSRITNFQNGERFGCLIQ